MNKIGVFAQRQRLGKGLLVADLALLVPLQADEEGVTGNEICLGTVLGLAGRFVGKLPYILYGLEQLVTEEKEMTRENFIRIFSGQQFELKGLEMDFSDDNQGSDFIAITTLDNDNLTAISEPTWQDWYK